MDQAINLAEDEPPTKGTAPNTELSLEVSGLYGPGAIACWYYIVTSVTLTWLFNPRCRFKVTNDFIAAIAYPIIANGHLLIQIIQLPPEQDDKFVKRLLSTFLNNPSTRSAVLEAEETYPGMVTIHVAMWVTGHFAYLCIIGFAIAYLCHGFSGHEWRQAKTVFLILSVSLLWNWTVNLTFLVRNWSVHAVIILLIGFLCRSGVVCSALLVFWLAFYFLLCGIMVKEASERPTIKEAFAKLFQLWEMVFLDGSTAGLKRWVMLAMIFVCLGETVVFGWFTTVFSPGMFFPDSGISVFELDQAAALVGGLLTLACTMCSVWKDHNAGFRG
jgi:hypothetical protein